MKMATLVALVLGLLVTLSGCASDRHHSAREDRVHSSSGGCCPGHWRMPPTGASSTAPRRRYRCVEV